MNLFLLHFNYSTCGGVKQGEASSPYGLDVLPASDTRHCSFLVLGSAVHCQQLGER